MEYADLNLLAEKYGDSFYLLEPGKFKKNLNQFLAAFQTYYPNCHIGYSYKTNYLPYLLAKAREQGAYAEVVSGMEYELARRIGNEGRNILFNGPLKTRADLFRAFEDGALVNLDNESEVNIIEEYLSRSPQTRISIGIRCNFSLDGDHSRFGFDVDDGSIENVFARLASKGCYVQGLHCHFTTKQRSMESYAARAEKLVRLAKKLFRERPPRFLDVGGGYFGKLPNQLKALFPGHLPSYEEYGKAVGSVISREYPNAEPELVLEPGVAVVSDVMIFVARVISIKKIGGLNIAIASGSRQNILPAGSRANLPVQVVSAPGARSNFKTIDITGYTCMENDVLCSSFEGKLGPGDFLMYSNMGAYTIVFKPPFIAPAPPIIAAENGEYVTVRRRESLDDILASFAEYKDV
jgi:diaminopimelate decarboxylase